MRGNIPNGHDTFQMAIENSNIFSFQGTSKFTQIWAIVLKTYHLATPAGHAANTVAIAAFRKLHFAETGRPRKGCLNLGQISF
jgi:hypothetical protein